MKFHHWISLNGILQNKVFFFLSELLIAVNISIDIHLHIKEPSQPTNLTFAKKKVGKEKRSFQAKGLNDFPWLNLQYALLEIKNGFSVRMLIFQLEEASGTIQGTLTFRVSQAGHGVSNKHS